MKLLICGAGRITDELLKRTSRIRAFDDNTVTISNGMFLNKAVSNANSGELAEQVVVEFSLPGHVNVREIKSGF